MFGTLVDSLEDLARINAGEETRIEKERIDDFHSESVQITKEIVRAANAGLAVKPLALEGVGGEITMDGERTAADTFTIPHIYTFQFDSKADDYTTAIKSPETQDFLKEVKCDPVYMKTGLKIGRKSSVESKRAVKKGVQMEAGFSIETVASIGPKARASARVVITQKAEEFTDPILAIRVRKLMYRRAGFLGLSNPRKVRHESSNADTELVGDDRRQAGPHKSVADDSDFELVNQDPAESDDSFQKFVRLGAAKFVSRLGRHLHGPPGLWR